jgi:hypothetical protein
MADLRLLSDPKAASERNLVDFIRTDLALCFTFAHLAETELRMQDREAAQRILEKAEIGYDTIARFLPDVPNAEQKYEIGRKLTALRARIDTLQRSILVRLEQK